MSEQYSNESMLDIYLLETTNNIEQLEQCILQTEKTCYYEQDVINEIFRIMHTIKGSSAMMLFHNISLLAHSMEDLFYFIREQNPKDLDHSTLSDIVLECVDFIKVELQKIMNGDADKDDSERICLVNKIVDFLNLLKEKNPAIKEKEIETPLPDKQQYYIAPNKKELDKLNRFKATIFFEEGCQMENIRGYSIIQNIKELCREVYYLPKDVLDNDESASVIIEEGFQIFIKTDLTYDEINKNIEQTYFLKEFSLCPLENDEEFKQFSKPEIVLHEPDVIKVPKVADVPEVTVKEEGKKPAVTTVSQSNISVSVSKLDKLMDLVGEMVIAEAMVTQNPELKDVPLNDFYKAAMQLDKITTEIQDIVMSIRMVPLSMTFQKMHRVVRDMSKKLNKDVKLELIGEETEVDKNIIERISDPLMHLVRNSIDHGIESTEDRERIGKNKTGRVTLEAKNAGGYAQIVIKDDGKGLNKESILKKAEENNLLIRPASEITDKEIFNLILLPGFSTKKEVSEFSGRGVGMDVVTKNIEMVGGSVAIDSIEGEGTTITLKIPLTLAIIEGMNISVGQSRYTIPITAIKESFRPKQSDVIKDTDGNEMIMVRGQCYPILRLHEHYNITTHVTDITKGILMMTEQEDQTICLFADELIGQQQVVVKSLPNYIKNIRKIRGLAGCTLLGDGSISLILDIGGLANS